MRTESIGILALMLIVLSSLETIRALQDDYITKINEFDEVGFNEFTELSVANKRTCKKKSDLYKEAWCLKFLCIKSCQEEGHEKGKCKKTKHDIIKSCYCYVDCVAPHVPAPSSPVVQPPSTPVNPPSPSTSPIDSPVEASPVSQPSSPAYSPETDVFVQPPDVSADAPEQVSPVDPPSYSADSPTNIEQETFWIEEAYNEFY